MTYNRTIIALFFILISCVIFVTISQEHHKLIFGQLFQKSTTTKIRATLKIDPQIKKTGNISSFTSKISQKWIKFNCRPVYFLTSGNPASLSGTFPFQKNLLYFWFPHFLGGFLDGVDSFSEGA